MKVRQLLITALGALALYACSSDKEPVAPVIEPENPVIEPVAGGPTSVELVVPVGCTSVRIDYPTASGVKSVTAPISPVAKATAGRSLSPITTTTLEINSAVDTRVSIYGEDATGKPYPLVENLAVAGGAAATKAGGLTLPEDAVQEYVTADGPFTFYHSSGVVMFDDGWPTSYTADGDFNDLVVDYDIEAKTVDASAAPSQLYRECLKVVMHLRAIGGGFPNHAGLMLEGLNTEFIESYEAKLTLGNWNEDVPAKGVKFNVDVTGEHPVLSLTNLNWMIQSGPTTATYINSKTGELQVINTPVKNPDYADDTTPRYYNVNKAYMNTGGDLYTLTVIFKGKDRSTMEATEGDAQVAHYIKAVTDIESQNFFLRTTDIRGAYEIHMKGYEPTPGYTGYAMDVTKGIAMNSSTTYCAQAGYVWGFKTPVLTRHAWEKTSFYKAYPEYTGWVTSGGAANADWYKHPDGEKVVFWW